MPQQASSSRTLPVAVSVSSQLGERPDGDSPTLSDALRGVSAERLPKDRPSVTVITGEGAGTLIRLGAIEVIFGRDKELAGLVDPALSRRHARFFWVDHEAYVQDLGSTNGTFVRGVRIDAPVRLEDGDHIQLGPDRVLRYSLYNSLEEDAAVQLYESSVQDLTSGAFNRRFFEERLEVEQLFAVRNAKPLALLLLDIDDFKLVNDTHGHVFGDAVLRVLAASISRMLRPEDFLGRYGGDEFVVLCHDTTLRNGLILAERIRSSTERLPFSAGGNEFHVTVSIGVAGTPNKNASRESLVAAADRAMYQAKLHGRNSIAGAD